MSYFQRDSIGDGQYEVFNESDDEVKLQKLKGGAFVGLFICFLCGIVSILCCESR